MEFTTVAKYAGFFLSIVLLTGCAKVSTFQVNSPDGKVQANFVLRSGKPAISLDYKNETVVRSITPGLEFQNSPAMDTSFHILEVSRTELDTLWEPVWGKTEHLRDHYNQVTVKIREQRSPSRDLTLILRAYNDGFAFRYSLPDQPGLSEFTLTNEKTTVRFAGNYSCYAQVHGGPLSNYEGTYDPTTLQGFSGEDRIGLPLLMEGPNCWLAVTEADLTDYAGMSLRLTENVSNTFTTTLSPDTANPQIKVRGSTPHLSPWRVFMIADHPGRMIESNLLWNLNDPSVLASTDWIEPGTVIWPWWNGRIAKGKEFSGEPSTALMKHYTDFAAEQGIPYLLVDAGWYSLEKDAWDQPEKEDIFTMEETRESYYDVREVIDYAKSRGVKVLLWVHIASLRDKVEEALTTYADWGAAGVKVDSYGGEYQDIVNDLHRILEVAADNQLLVNFHGAYKPTGVERTYPNFMTREGVAGLEQAKFSNRITPGHDVTLPYTRMLLGHMDYTPGAFDLDGTHDRPKKVQGTRAHQMAMYVVYFSPLQMLVDYPAAYLSAPEQFEFLRQVPTVWDETRFLQGEVGEYIILARRKGADWYIGAMTNENPRDVKIPLDFLPGEWEYTAQIYRDGLDANVRREHVVVRKRQVKSSTTLAASLAGGGGLAVRLTPDSSE